MTINTKKYFKLSLIILLLIILTFLINNFLHKLEKDKVKSKQPISINLIANVHPNLPWNFKPLYPKIIAKPGEIITIKYEVENLSDIETTGIATFAYYPKEFKNYLSKLNCFCYDGQTLKPNQKNSFSVVLLIDPEVTKDSKTKNVKEVTIQFTFLIMPDIKRVKANYNASNFNI